MPQIHLNKSNFFNNLTYYAQLAGSKEKICLVLKDNAYGHGLKEMATMAVEFGISHTFVKNFREAETIKNIGFKSIMVLQGIPDKKTAQNHIMIIRGIEQLAKMPAKTKIELVIDTGMHRNGIMPNMIDEALLQIQQRKLKLNGIFTHFSSADEENNRIFEQEQKFKECVQKIMKEQNKWLKKQKIRKHCANTDGTHRINPREYDLIRIGFGAYGYGKYGKGKIKPVLSLYANKISTRKLSKGDTIGYGSKAYVVPHDNFTVSNYDIGYGDGFFRLSEHKKATIADGRPILGRVSMDCLSVEGKDDKICIFDNATQLAKIHQTIEYEILSHLNPNIKRLVI